MESAYEEWLANKVRTTPEIMVGDVIYATVYDETLHLNEGIGIIVLDERGEKVIERLNDYYYNRKPVYDISRHASLFKKLLEMNPVFFENARMSVFVFMSTMEFEDEGEGDDEGAPRDVSAIIRLVIRDADLMAAKKREAEAAVVAFKALPEEEQRAMYDRMVQEADQLFDWDKGGNADALQWSDSMKLAYKKHDVSKRLGINIHVCIYLMIKYNTDDINYQNIDGDTVFHILARNPVPVEMAEKLLEKYAETVDLFIRNKKGKTALESYFNKNKIPKIMHEIENRQRVRALEPALIPNVGRAIQKYLGGSARRHRKLTRRRSSKSRSRSRRYERR
jgi:hypothetical protein